MGVRSAAKWLIVVLSFLSLERADSSKILGVLPTLFKSHYLMFEPLLTELASRGHELTVVNCFPQNPPVKGIKDIDVSPHIEKIVNQLDVKAIGERGSLSNLQFINISVAHIDKMSAIFDAPQIKELLHSKETKFDLIITELFQNDVELGFAHRFKAPNIVLCSGLMLPWGNMRFANPDNPSYIPEMFGEFGVKMSFWQRLLNSARLLTYKWFFYAIFTPRFEGHAKRHFGEEMPSLLDLGRNTSLVLYNSHHSLTGARPLVPAVVEVGGLHVKDAKQLPKELQTYLDESKHGVIYFCMGSMLKASTIPDDKRDALVEVFSKLKQNVLWKWEDDTLPGKPDNVKLVKWMPQRDVLAHPNVKLFISHGGLLGTTEAVYCGVPIIGIPFYGDQGVNIEAVASNGAGLRLDFHDINSETLYKAITEILNNPKYSENAKSLSERFRDRPLSPLETAVYWTEYVIRHKGAPHLRSAAVDLTWYQYLLLDVIAFILAILTSILLVFYYSIKFVIKRFRSSKKDAKEHQEQKFKKQTSQKPKVKKS